MKIINDSNLSKKLLVSAGIGVVSGFALLFLLLLFFALIMLKVSLSDSGATVMSTIALMIASMFSGLVSSKLSGLKRMPIALVTGFAFYLTVAIISAAITKDSFGKLFLIRMILCIASSAIGAIIGAVNKQNKNYI